MASKPALCQSEASIVDALQRYDRQLNITWNPKINRWELRRKGNKGNMLIAKLEHSDGSYMKIDNRLLHYIANTDTWRFKNTDAIEREMAENYRKQEEEKDKRLYNTIYDKTIDNYSPLKRALEEKGVI